jgi:hypothetical protein
MGCIIKRGGFPFYGWDGPQVDDARFETDFGPDLKSNFSRESSKYSNSGLVSSELSEL